MKVALTPDYRKQTHLTMVTPKPLVVNLEFHLDLVNLVSKNFKIKHFLLFYYAECEVFIGIQYRTRVR